VPLPHVPRLQKQSFFNLSGCRFGVAAALGSEDHQLRSMLPRTALLDMLGLLQDEAGLSALAGARAEIGARHALGGLIRLSQDL
jgi:hypothetical protein